MTTELARQAWAREVIGSLPWSLAFVDEATTGGLGVRDLIEQLRAAHQTERLCVALQPSLSRRFRKVSELVTWDFGQVSRLPRDAELIPYRRLPEEIAVRERLDAIEQEFGAGTIIRQTLEAAWRSSASSFEFVLARHASLLDTPHDARGGATQSYLGRAPEFGGNDVFVPSGAIRKARAWRSPLAMQFGELDRDSKLEACLAYVVSTLRDHRIALFTAMRQTALYLHAALQADDVRRPSSMALAQRWRGRPEHVQVMVLTEMRSCRPSP